MISSLSEIRHLNVDEARLRTHVMLPRHTLGITSSKGLEDYIVRPAFDFLFVLGGVYRFDGIGFVETVHAALKDQVAGYVIQLRQHGSPIFTRAWHWAKTPADGTQAWAPAVRLHIASCSKFVTAVAMTRLLHEQQISVDTPIVGFLPVVLGEGAERRDDHVSPPHDASIRIQHRQIRLGLRVHARPGGGGCDRRW